MWYGSDVGGALFGIGVDATTSFFKYGFRTFEDGVGFVVCDGIGFVVCVGIGSLNDGDGDCLDACFVGMVFVTCDIDLLIVGGLDWEGFSVNDKDATLDCELKLKNFFNEGVFVSTCLFFRLQGHFG